MLWSCCLVTATVTLTKTNIVLRPLDAHTCTPRTHLTWIIPQIHFSLGLRSSCRYPLQSPCLWHVVDVGTIPGAAVDSTVAYREASHSSRLPDLWCPQYTCCILFFLIEDSNNQPSSWLSLTSIFSGITSPVGQHAHLHFLQPESLVYHLQSCVCL